MAEGAQGGASVAKDLVLEGSDQVEEEHVELQDGLGAGERREAEAVGGEIEFEFLDAVFAVGTAVVEAPDLFRRQGKIGDDGVECVAGDIEEATASGIGAFVELFADDDETARDFPREGLPGQLGDLQAAAKGAPAFRGSDGFSDTPRAVPVLPLRSQA